jgi:hypothetical protein
MCPIFHGKQGHPILRNSSQNSIRFLLGLFSMIKKSAGYGFVSFGTKEEAEAALTELDGKVTCAKL